MFVFFAVFLWTFDRIFTLGFLPAAFPVLKAAFPSATSDQVVVALVLPYTLLLSAALAALFAWCIAGIIGDSWDSLWVRLLAGVRRRRAARLEVSSDEAA